MTTATVNASKESRVLPLDVLISDDNVNVRLSDNYDLETMESQLMMTGYVTDPITVEPILSGPNAGKFLILKGNRRFRTCLKIVASDKYTDAQKEPFRQLTATILTGLTPSERTNIIFDHGTTRNLNREETALAVWRLAMEMKSPKEIASLMYTQLAQMGDLKKLAQIPTDPVKREEYLTTWFTGTLDQWLMSGSAMGDYIRNQFLLTLRYQDGRLPVTKDDKKGWELDCTRPRTRKLWAAKKKDQGPEGEGWNPVDGGKNFNELLEQYKAEDAGTANGSDNKRLSVAETEKRIGMFQSDEMKTALQATIGDKEAGRNLKAIDDRINRDNMVRAILAKAFPNVADGAVKGLITALLSTGPAADVEGALAPFTSGVERIVWVPREIEVVRKDDADAIVAGHLTTIEGLQARYDAEVKNSQTLSGEVDTLRARVTELESDPRPGKRGKSAAG